MGVIGASIGVGPVFATEPQPTAFPAIDGPDQLPTLLGMLEDHAPEGPSLIVVPTWGPTRQREAYDAARMLLGGRRVLVVDTALPPLAATALVSLVQAVADRVGGVEVAATLLRPLEREVLAFAWLSSVTGLGNLDVPLSLHARSYVSRRGFVVDAHPTPGVRPVTKEDGPLDLGLPPRSRALVSDHQGDEHWRDEVLRPGLGSADVDLVAAPDASAAWWGARRFVEVAVLDADLRAVTDRALAATRIVVCGWCGGPATDGTCPRCLADVPAHDPAPALATVGAPADAGRAAGPAPDPPSTPISAPGSPPASSPTSVPASSPTPSPASMPAPTPAPVTAPTPGPPPGPVDARAPRPAAPPPGAAPTGPAGDPSPGPRPHDAATQAGDDPAAPPGPRPTPGGG